MKSSFMPKILTPEPKIRLSSPTSEIGTLQKKKPLKPIPISTDSETLFLKDSVDTKMLMPSTVGSLGPSSIENNNSLVNNSMRLSPIGELKLFKTPLNRNSSVKTLKLGDGLNQSSGIKLSRRQSVGRFSETKQLLDEIINTPDLIETEVHGKAAIVSKEPLTIYRNKLNLINNYEFRKTTVVDDSKFDYVKQNAALLESLKNFKYIAIDKISALQPEDHDLIKKIDKILAESFTTQKQERVMRELGIQENVWNTIEVENSKFTYFSFECKAENFPLKIQIKTEEGINKVKSYVSFTNKKPNNMNFDFNFESKTYKFLQKKKSKDLNEYVSVYFALMTDGTGKIGFRVEITESVGDPRRKDLMAKIHRRARSEMNPFELAELEAEIKQIKDEKQKRLVNLAGGKNHLEYNRDVAKFEPQNAKQRRETVKLKLKNLELMEGAAMRKQLQIREEMEKKRLNFYGIEFAKVLKEYIMDKEREKVIRAKWSKKWLKFLFMEKVCKEIVNTIALQKQKIEARKTMAAHIAAFKTVTRIRMRLKGATLQDRLIHEARMTFQNLALFFRPSVRRDAALVIAKSLEKTKPIYFLHRSFMNLVITSQRIQRCWRAFKRRKNEFRVVLNDLWEKYYLQVYNDPENQAFFEAAGGSHKLHGEELKNDEIGKRQFMQQIFVQCLKKYLANTSFSRIESLNLSPEEKKKQYVTKKWMAVNQRRIEQEKLLQMQQQGIVPQTVKKKKKKEGMFEENAEDGGESPTKAQNLRLFVLPTTTELFELLKKAIASQKTAKYL